VLLMLLLMTQHNGKIQMAMVMVITKKTQQQLQIVVRINQGLVEKIVTDVLIQITMASQIMETVSNLILASGLILTEMVLETMLLGTNQMHVHLKKLA
tara:strand:- start:3072 stop:3365 length:294 start_codon:yes stop_codon:yes gene_type:complete